MINKMFQLTYRGPFVAASLDPVGYLASEISGGHIEGRTRVRTYPTNKHGGDFVIPGDNFEVQGMNVMFVRIRAETIEGIREGKTFVEDLGHHAGIRDYELSTMSNDLVGYAKKLSWAESPARGGSKE